MKVNETIVYHLLRDSDLHAVLAGAGDNSSCFVQALNYLGLDKISKIKCILDLSPRRWGELDFEFRIALRSAKYINEPELSKKFKPHDKIDRKNFVEAVKKFYSDTYRDKIEIIELDEINYVTGNNAKVMWSIYVDSKYNKVILVNILPREREYGYNPERQFYSHDFSQIKQTDGVTIVFYEENNNRRNNRKIDWKEDPFGTNGSKYSNFTFFNFLTSQGEIPEWPDNFFTSEIYGVNAKVFDKLMTVDEKFQNLIEYCKFIAGHDENVLILGETGVGKELFARGIHEYSLRSGDFVAVNCAAIPDSLFESEMFGIKKGAFTDAKEDREGYFQLAKGGTLFLDEIGDLSLRNQAKILRAIQEKNVVRVGGKGKTETTDVRLICATNKDLSDSDKSEFRSDLLFRVGVLQIVIPPLQERGQDEIRLLIYYFMQRMRRKYDSYRHIIFGIEAMKFIKKYDWPGNVRQLESFVYNILMYAEYQMKKRREELVENSESNQINIPDIRSYTISESEVRAFLIDMQSIGTNQMAKVDKTSVQGKGQETLSDKSEGEDLINGSELLIKDILKDLTKVKDKLHECNNYINGRVHEELLKEYKTESKVGEILGVKQQTISSRRKKFGLKKKD